MRRFLLALLSPVLAVAALSIGLIGGEFAVRLFAPQQLILKRADIWEPVEGLGWKHRGSLNASINTGERTVRVFTDSEGFRVGSKGRPEVGRRVLLLGDSFMEAFQVEQEQSLAGLMEGGLKQPLGQPIRVWNTGVGGWDPDQYLMQARSALANHEFDLVLVSLYMGNDVMERPAGRLPPRAPAEVHDFRIPRRLSRGEITDAVLYPINDMLEVRSHLFILFKNGAQAVRIKLGISADYFPNEFRRSFATSKQWDATADICDSIAAEARQHGAAILFVLIPHVMQVDSAALATSLRAFKVARDSVDINQPSKRFQEMLTSRGLPVVDALPAFRAAFGKGLQLHGSVDSHLSPRGHRVLFDALGSSISERLAK